MKAARARFHFEDSLMTRFKTLMFVLLLLTFVCVQTHCTGKELSSPLMTPYAADLIPEGWTVVEDVEPKVGLDVANLEFVNFLKNEGEENISGAEMRRRAAALKGNLGLTDMKSVLNQQEKIPPQLRGYLIVFAGTVLHDADDDPEVPYLEWHDDRWYRMFAKLGYVWSGQVVRLARYK